MIDLYEIGKPISFQPKADPNNRHSSYLKSKMSVIDIIPCTASIDLNEIKKAYESPDGGNLFNKILPRIEYEPGIARFKKILQAYNLTPVKGIRLFLTDDTVATDTFSNAFQDNMFQGMLNKLSGHFAQAKQAAASLFGNVSYTNAVENNSDKIQKQISSVLGKVMSENAANEAASALVTLGKTVALGNKIPLPKIWYESKYDTGLTATIKLVSPYGHPDAVKEYIIEPLMYIIAMAAPQTSDGISYGQALTFTLRAYGVSKLILASVANVTLRRGGNDTSFNVYRQPLTIDVSIQFQQIVDGFGVFTSSANPENDVISEANIPINANSGLSSRNSALFQTLGSVVESLRPVNLQDTSVNEKNLGIDGILKVLDESFKEQADKLTAQSWFKESENIAASSIGQMSQGTSGIDDKANDIVNQAIADNYDVTNFA